jgi:methyl-accepting chemotaxis protein
MLKKISSLTLNFVQVIVFLVLMIPALMELDAMKGDMARNRTETNLVISDIFTLNQLVQNIKFDAVQVQQWFTDISATRGLDGLDDGDEKAAEFAESFRKNLALAQDLSRKLELKDVEEPLTQLEKDFPGYFATGQKMAAAYVAEGPAGGNLVMEEFDGAAEKISISMNALTETLAHITAEKQKLVESNFASVADKTEDVVANIVMTLGLATLIAIVSTVIISYQRRRMLRGLADTFQEKVKGATDHMSGGIKTLLDKALSLKQEAALVMDKMENLNSESQKTSGNIQIVASSVEELAASVGEISRQVSMSFDLVQDTKTRMNSANASARKLGEATENISGVVGLIEKIAGQISMLALNATIEAARAGEAGKGFAVVAGEVKNLASETAKATDDITHRLSDIQDSSSVVVEEMGSLEMAISSLNDYITGISTAVEEQSSVTQDLSGTMRGMATSSSNISDDIGEVKSLASESQDEAEEVLSTSRFISEQNFLVEGAVGEFLTTIRRR